ncbi:MAG: hypothetical protein XD76_1443 [candidate division TA06 bacterium 32_111]|uniref:Uncharacterized protein n=2 Tax=Bacteria candidate phyla TaxID=1783234 RepID=A0A101I0U2_UNCT6|nr:MAG: hypothetical protein XD76_1443 [candidate division TA06 bacterium 32_111]KUK86701.1 MAG: hypothetical protein XE03_1299 [candidate division TA06 bacterium 34_109]
MVQNQERFLCTMIKIVEIFYLTFLLLSFKEYENIKEVRFSSNVEYCEKNICIYKNLSGSIVFKDKKNIDISFDRKRFQSLKDLKSNDFLKHLFYPFLNEESIKFLIDDTLRMVTYKRNKKISDTLIFDGNFNLLKYVTYYKKSRVVLTVKNFEKIKD